MWNLLVILLSSMSLVHGHGYLYDPPARSTAWLVDPSFRGCCTYSNHMEMFCGGTQHQWNSQGGKCGICGEAYDKPNKLFEKGGAMYKGTSVKTYTQGEQIDVKVMLTANHKGYFEFRLCNVDPTPDTEASQECLDQGLLKFVSNGLTKFRDVDKYGSQMITLQLQLPPDVACKHCVFQWKYTTGNSWGTDPSTGQSGLGLGRENETFMGCADITIVASGEATKPPLVIIPTTPSSTTTNSAAEATPKPSDPTTSKPSGGVTTWSAGNIQYKVGDQVWYNGVLFRCVHPHTSFPGAEPGIITWAWWQPAP